LEGAVQFSKRVEGFYLSKQPNPRKKKPGSWHKANVWKVTNHLLENGRFGYLDPGERESKMPLDELKLQALNYASGSEMDPTTQKLFLALVTKSAGRDRFKLTNAELAKAAGVDRSTVKRLKQKFGDNNFITCEGNFYRFK
jgi:hypothetical protein